MNRHQVREASLLLVLSAVQLAAQTPANWTFQNTRTAPSLRFGHAMAYDSAHGQVVLFGGQDGFAPNNETWVWDGAKWTQLSPQNSPQPRSDHAMAYDAAHGQVVLFGGYNDGPLNDTWVWNGTNWAQRSAFTGPPIRSRAAMAYDAKHSLIVLFGGIQEAYNSTLNDTWTWDGSSWSQRSPSTNPEPLQAAAMAYDAAHGQAVLFGGAPTLFLPSVNDTWLWDGTNWSKKSPQTSPSVRQRHAMAYDAAHAQVLLFGGSTNGFKGDLGDTWVWDGVNWTQKSPANNPPPRDGHAMAYDSAHTQVLLFGGAGSQDTWTWFGGSAGLPPTINAVISASGFGGSATVAPGSWVEIYGSGLASTTRSWGTADFSGNNAPTSLDNVQVNIGGQNAFVDYVSTAGQINAQLPSNIATGGTLPITVTNGSNTSAAFNVPVKPTSAALLAPASFQIGGKQYLVALLPDGVTYILPPNAIPGVASRQAHPGETIVTYGIGFGSVNPPIDAGQIVTVPNQLASSLQIQFGQTPAQTQYAGLAPGFVGLYQFNIVVPPVPDNDLVLVTFTLGGVPGSQTLYIAVHQ